MNPEMNDELSELIERLKNKGRPELSESFLPDPTKRYGETDFQCEAALIALDNKEYEYILNEDIKPDTAEQKEIKTADNIYDIRNFFRDHFSEIQQNKDLQKSLKRKIEGLKKLVKGTTEIALLMTLESRLNDLADSAEDTE